jgi:hypothetical protein
VPVSSRNRFRFSLAISVHKSQGLKRRFAVIKMLTLSVLLAVALAYPRPEVTMSVTDASAPGSPLALSGSVTAIDRQTEAFRYSLHADVSAKNLSRKDIILLVMEIDVTGANKVDIHDTGEYDYFFASEIFEGSGSRTFGEDWGPFGEPQGPVEGKPTRPRTVARVAFAQFSDGSTWGDPMAGKSALSERSLTYSKLLSLSETYQQKGTRVFGEELSEPSDLPELRNLQQLYTQNSKDTNAVFRRVTRMLENADLHRAAMRAGTMP